MTKAVNDAMDRNSKKQKKIENFSDILDGLEETEDKKKIDTLKKEKENL